MSSVQNQPISEPSAQVSSNSTVAVASTKDVTQFEVSAPVVTQVSENEGSALLHSTLFERFILVDQYEWSSASVDKEYSFPAVLNSTLDPVLNVMRSFAFWKADVELQFKVSSTKFQIGQLYCWYLYSGISKEESLFRTQNGCVVNIPGEFLNAASSNEVLLTVPYQSTTPFRSTSADLFKFGIHNWAGLSSPQAEPQTCTVSIYVRVKSAEFMGVHAIPQMMTLMRSLLRGSEAALASVREDLNRDNPSDPSNPIVVVPRNTQSWCAGDQYVENLNVLRLNPTTTVSHRVSSDEMRVSYLASRFGFYSKFDWSRDSTLGECLWSTLVSPVNLHRREIKTDGYLQKVGVPAITALASQFTYWSGDLEFRFEMIASGFHNGQIAICYIPNETVAPQYIRAKSSYGAIVPLDGITSYKFRVPFKFYKPWARCYDGLRDALGETSGVLAVYVLNKLTSSSNASNRVRCLVYLRAADNFRLSVPSAPFLTTPFESKIPKDLFITMYDEKLTLCRTKVITTTSNNAAKTIYVLEFSADGQTWSENVRLRYPSGKDYDNSTSILCSLIINFQFKPRNEAVRSKSFRYGTWFQNGAGTTYRTWRISLGLKADDTNDGRVKHQGDFIQTIQAIPPFFDVVKVLPQAGEQTQDIMLIPSFGKMGADVHGEQFDDLKSLCRRYVYYGEFSGKISKAFPLDKAFAVVPLYVDGLKLDMSRSSAAYLSGHAIRHSTIATVASAFKYYRGGLRFKIQVHATDADLQDATLHLCVMHIPDYHISSRKILSFDTTIRSYYPSGHAYYVQSTSQNPILEIEVPYYKDIEYGLLGRTDDDRFSEASLGSLVFSLKSKVVKDINVAISLSYSIADDMRFYCYQGFMTMVKAPSLVTERDFPVLQRSGVVTRGMRQQPEGSDSESYDIVEPEAGVIDAVLHPVNTVNSIVRTMGTEFAQGAADSVAEDDRIHARVIASAGVIGNQIVQTADEASRVVIDRIREALLELKTQFSWMKDFNVSQFLISFSSQVAQVFYNPCVATLSICIASIMAQLVVTFGSSDGLSCCYEKLLQAYRKLVQYFMPSQAERISGQQEVIANPESLTEGEECAAAATLVSAIAACFGVGYDLSTSGRQYVLKHLRKDLQTFSATANSLVIFFNNNISLLRKILNWIQSKVMPQLGFFQEMVECEDAVNKWCRESRLITNPVLRQEVRSSAVQQFKLFRLMLKGEQLTLRTMNCPRSDPALLLIQRTTNDLRKVMDEITADCLVPGTKFEPFVIHLVGEPGIGKSFLVNKLATELMKHVNYVTYQRPVYVKTPGVEFWNGLAAQPVLHMDDFMFSQENGMAQACELFCLKSPAVFNPPQAALEDKKRFYSPKIVLLTGNIAYPDCPDIVVPDALYRRRDQLVGFRLKSKYKTVADVESREILNNFDHLEVCVNSSPRKPSEANGGHQFWKKDLPSQKWISFSEWLADLKQKFAEYYQNEILNVQDRIRHLTALFPADDQLLFEESADNVDHAFDAMIKRRLDDDADNIRNFIASNSSDIADERGERSAKEYMELLARNATVPLVEIQSPQSGHGEGSSSQPLLAEEEDVDEDDDGRPVQIGPAETGTRKVLLTEVMDNSGKTEFVKFQAAPCVIKQTQSVLDNTRDSYSIPITRRCLMKVKINDNVEVERVVPNTWLPERPHKLVYSGALFYPNCPHPRVFSDAWSWDRTDQMFVHSDGIHTFKEARCKGKCHWDNSDIRINWYREFAKFWAATYVPRVDLTVDAAHIPKFLIYNDYLIRDVQNSESRGSFGSLRIRTHSDNVPPVEQRITLSKLSLDYYREQLDNCCFGWLKKMCVTICKWLAGLGLFVGTLALGAAAWNAYSGRGGCPLQPVTTTTPDPYNEAFPVLQSNTYSGGDRPDKFIKSSRAKENFRKLKEKIVKAQAGEAEDIAVRLFRRNFCRLRVPRPDGKLLTVFALGISDRTILTVGHAFQELVEMGDGELFEISIGNSKFIQVPFHPASLANYTNAEVCTYNLPLNIPCFRDIRRHIATAAEQANMPYEAFVGRLQYNDKLEPMFVGQAVKIKSTPSVNIATLDNTDYYSIYKNIWTYSGYSGQGFCGSILFSLEPFKIYGMHIAGTGTIGYSEPIIRESFNLVKATAESGLEIDEMAPVKLNGAYGLGQLLPGTIPHLSNKTKIRESIMAEEVFPIYKVPAPLSKENPYGENLTEHPLTVGVEKHMGSPLPFDDELIAVAQEDLLLQLITHAKPVLPGRGELLTDQDIFSGISGVAGYRHLELNTSEGYPLSLFRPKTHNNKKWLFEYKDSTTGRELISIKPELADMIEEHMELRRQGVIPPTIFQDCLKDARIDKSKINVPGKTRVFSISPIEYTWTVKKYFGHFQAAYQRGRPETGCAIGINPNGREWNQLVHYLSQASLTNIVTGDYKSFGDRLQSACLHAAFNIMIDWYEHYYGSNSETRKIREVIRDELLHVPHIAGAYVYKMFCGLPSGFALTVELNSLVNCLYIRICWMIIMKGPYQDLSFFNKFCRLVTYGDDLILSVGDEVIEDFNFNSIKTVLEAHLIEFTSATKDVNDTRPCMSIYESTFLKRSFAHHPQVEGWWMAPLEYASIVDCINWVHSKGNEQALAIANSKAVAESAYCLGPIEYEKIRKRIQLWWTEHGEKIEIPSWKSVDARVWGTAGYAMPRIEWLLNKTDEFCLLEDF